VKKGKALKEEEKDRLDNRIGRTKRTPSKNTRRQERSGKQKNRGEEGRARSGKTGNSYQKKRGGSSSKTPKPSPGGALRPGRSSGRARALILRKKKGRRAAEKRPKRKNEEPRVK